MSLINQMLRDLDKGRGPVKASQIAALQGMGLISINRFKRYDSLSLTAWGLAGLLTIVLSYQASIWWNSRPESEPVIAAQTAPETAKPQRNAQLDTVAPQDNVNTEPLATTANKAEFQQKPLDIPVPSRAETVPTALPTAVETASKPVTILTPEQKAERLFTKAQQALSRNQQQRGENLLRKALDEYSRHVSARSQLAALLLSRQQEDKAERLLSEGLLTDAHQLALARPYAQLLAARGELGPALKTLDRAITRRQADPETLALSAAILYKMERHAESAAAYRKAVQGRPKRALWWTGLAVALEQDGQPRQALEAFQRAAELPLDKPVDDYVKQRIGVLSNKDFHY